MLDLNDDNKYPYSYQYHSKKNSNSSIFSDHEEVKEGKRCSAFKPVHKHSKLRQQLAAAATTSSDGNSEESKPVPSRLNRDRIHTRPKRKSNNANSKENEEESNDESNSSVLSSPNKKDSRKFPSHRSKNRDHSVESTASTNTLTSLNARNGLDDSVLTSSPCNPNKFSCSSSFIDLCTLIFRYKDVCHSLVEMVISNDFLKHNHRFFQAKFNCINNMFQVKQNDKMAFWLMTLLKERWTK